MADVHVAVHDFANGGEQLFLRRSFHHVTLRAGTESALCENGLLESGINEDQQSRTLRFKTFQKLEAVAGPQSQRSEQQWRFAFLDFVTRVTKSRNANRNCCSLR